MSYAEPPCDFHRHYRLNDVRDVHEQIMHMRGSVLEASIYAGPGSCPGARYLNSVRGHKQLIDEALSALDPRRMLERKVGPGEKKLRARDDACLREIDQEINRYSADDLFPTTSRTSCSGIRARAPGSPPAHG